MSNLYPSLKEFNQPRETTEIVRLNVISATRTFLEQEVDDRRKIIKKYKKAYTTLDVFNNAAGILSIATGITGVSLLSTVVAAPICISLEGVSGICAISSVVCNVSCKKIIRKIEKHENVYILAMSKLNTINELVSKSLEDGVIDAVEFRLILDEKEKYLELKDKFRKNVIEEKVDMVALKKQVLEEMMNKMKK